MSEIRVDRFKAEDGIGAPQFPNGINVTGVVTATVLDATVPFLTVGNNAQLGNAGIITATGANISGDLSAVNGTFSGNVTIGGTLTYEDVTNIDSVGLITARNGISVSSGGLKVLAGGSNFNSTITGTATTSTTITVSDESSNTSCNLLFATSNTGNVAPKTGSNLTFNSSNGALSATTFVGSGSQLTSLPAGQLTGSLPAIDGSALTGIDASAITTGTTKVQTNATSIVSQVSGSGIGTFTAQGLNVTGIVTATSMKVFDSGIDYEWQGGTSMAWWKSEDIVSTSSWPAAKGGSDANLVSHNGSTTGVSVITNEAAFNNHKCIRQNGNNTGGLRTSNQTVNYWWNGSDAFTVIMAIQKDSHTSGSNYGDSYFVHNVNTNNAQNSWSIGPFGDHTWGGQYGEMWGGIQNYFEGLEMRFSYPWRGLFMIRVGGSYDYGELSVNAGSGWQRLDQRHNGPSSLGSTFRGMSIFTNSNGETGHTAVGRIAEWAYWRNERLGGNELDAITKSWCHKFNF